MPRNKDLKRLVRARMTKTGESYTAARAQIMAKPTERASAAAVDLAALAGMSDDAVREKTGCTWARWVKALDQAGADKLPHRQIVEIVHGKYKIEPWWSQMVTVGYERIKGIRARGQRRDGSYEASKSRTYEVPVATLFRAWADARLRKRWLGEDAGAVKVRTATAPKSMRLDWRGGPDGAGGIIAVGFFVKGDGRSSVALSHTKLPDRETADRLKQYWSERLSALGETLAAHRR
jgi:uncharacterized protein YndB with AHSA1/START domain